MTLHSMVAQAFGIVTSTQERNEQKLKEIEEIYLNCKNLPRKKKKQIKKKALIDYSFFKSLGDFEKKMFGNFTL